MIIELFGPAGAGKTTFAHALRERLNANGHTAEVVLSYQPGAEVSPLDSGGAMAAARRIARAITGTVAIAARPIVRRNEFALAFKLVRALPPRSRRPLQPARLRASARSSLELPLQELPRWDAPPRASHRQRSTGHAARAERGSIKTSRVSRSLDCSPERYPPRRKSVLEHNITPIVPK